MDSVKYSRTVGWTLVVCFTTLLSVGAYLEDKIQTNERNFRFNTTMAKLIKLNVDLETLARIIEKRKS